MKRSRRRKRAAASGCALSREPRAGRVHGRSESYRPFKGLKGLLKENSFPLAGSGPGQPVARRSKEQGANPYEDEILFKEAMANVELLPRDDCPPDAAGPKPANAGERNPDADAMARMEKLVNSGEGFVVADTDEYIEGTGYGIDSYVVRRLHRGDFSIQACIDLHGLGVEPAREAFDGFMKDALVSGKRAVKVVHGRGLSSRHRPVLKAKVEQWLTSGRWRKWVIAFTSAMVCDGGAGATYILLRERPATRRHRRKRCAGDDA